MICVCVCMQHSWKWFLYNRSQNVNRSEQKSGAPPRKRSTLEHNRAVHLYPPVNGEDDISYSRNLELLKAELGKHSPRTEALKSLICQIHRSS